MRKFLSWATLVAALTSAQFSASRAIAQQRPAGSAPQIAVLDLSYIFDQHIRFRQLGEELRRDVEAASNELTVNKQQLRKLAEQLDGYNRGSPEFKQLEEDLTKRQAEMQVQLAMQKRDFAEREAKIYYGAYKEVMEHVHSYAERHGILLVLQFNGAPVDETDGATIRAELGKLVLFHHPSIDITPIILDMVNPPTRANNNRQTPPQMTTRPQGPSRMGVPPPNKKR